MSSRAAGEPTASASPDSASPVEQAATAPAAARPAGTPPGGSLREGPTRTSQRTVLPGSPATAYVSSASHARDPRRYRVLGEHGRGGLGRVSRVHDLEIGRDIAIKEMIARSHVGEVRFLREALITARLEHPGIVPVYEAGRWPDGTPFYAMKLVAGRSLRDLIAERHTVDERIGLLHHVIAVADAIAYAHGRNIIHRDLKPGNVIVGDFGETVVIDWGLAKDLTVVEEATASSPALHITEDDGLTSAGTILGTPSYMPPEQARGEAVDQRADVFAIGAMLWELCSVERLPPAYTRQRHRILRRAGIDQDLATIIEKAVAPDPAQRYPDAGALAADLKAFKAGARIAARDYSLFATLARWTRRHRARALTALAVTACAVAGVLLYIRNITEAGEKRDRALELAQRERDRAKLSEASLLLAKDPARSKEILGTLTATSPQYGLVMSRAIQHAAIQVLRFPDSVQATFRAGRRTDIAVLTMDHMLYQIDPWSGARQLVARDIGGAVTYHAGEWIYSVREFGSNTVRLAGSSRRRAFDTHGLEEVKAAASLEDAVYVLDASARLYRVSDRPPELIREGVHNMAGDGHLLLVCQLDGTFEAIRDGAVAVRRRCPRIRSPDTLSISGDDYAALTESGVVVLSRHGQTTEITTDIRDEHELALTNTGLLAIADYGHRGRTWFVRSGSALLEEGPRYPGQLISVAAGGPFAAWGYSDGTIIVFEPTTDTTWQLTGHPNAIEYMTIIEQDRRLVSLSSNELGTWNLAPQPVATVTAMPCRTFNFMPSPDGRDVGIGCRDGSAWVWERSSGAVRQLHRHGDDLSYSVQWLGDKLCTGGWNGQILCSTPDGAHHELLEPNAGKIVWLAAGPRHDFLVAATADGRIWKVDDQLHELYSQQAVPCGVSVAPDNSTIASCGLDGSVVIFDITTKRILSRIMAHVGAVRSLMWYGNTLWTAGADGWLRRWDWSGHSLELRQIYQVSNPLRLTVMSPDGWVSGGFEGELLIGQPGGVPLRLGLERRINRIDASSDGRYVAASILGEVIVVDVQQRKVATLPVDTTSTGGMNFVDSTTLAVSTAKAIRVIHVADLHYTQF